jgi:hypothetical protein
MLTAIQMQATAPYLIPDASNRLDIATSYSVPRAEAKHRAVAGARMVGMAVRDDGLVDRPRGIDEEAAGLATHARRRRHQEVFGTHVA